MNVSRPWRLMALAAITAGGLAIAGCSGGGSQPEPSDDVTSEDTGATLNLWVRPGNEAVTDAVVDAYNESHENKVEITHVPDDQYMTKFAQASQTGDLPDIIAADLVLMPQIIDTGAVLDITALLENSGATENLAPAHISASTADGKVYGVPYVLDSSLYLYNKDLFEQAGLDPEDPPSTWDELRAAAEAVSGLGDDYIGLYMSAGFGGALAYDFTPFVWAQGAEVVNEDGSYNLDSPEVVGALQFFQGLREDGLYPASAQTDAGEGFFAVFNGGNVGINISGGNGVNTATLGQDPAFDFGLAPIPGPEEGQTASFSGGDVASISATSEHPNEAWNFIEWLSSKDTSDNVYLGLPALPPRTDVTAPSSLGEQFTVPAELVKTGQTFVSTYFNEVIKSAQGPYVAMFQSTVFDGADAEEASKQAQEAADSITQ